ncbi:hypothetical protein NNJEOMEG_03745 [Fundidesulfovibrio magnetotacticus]|uniref:Uncharacterized protein n=1 Tax=Fundidesulfovibrio magnetotacticus TaxID=2730080 RepID=A0A6V8LTS9_9BACT|nr:hypothetical protein NNJEOMEG_03745 [Fundidesulfovibrio magnetotacticus]
MDFESFPGIKGMALNFMMDNGMMDNTPKMDLARLTPGQGDQGAPAAPRPIVEQLASSPSDGGASKQEGWGASAPEAGGPPPEAGAAAPAPAPSGATPHVHTFGTGARSTVDPYGRNGPRVDPTPLNELNAFKTGGNIGDAAPKPYPWQKEHGPRGAAVPALHPGLGESEERFESAGRGAGTVSRFLRSQEGGPFQNEDHGVQPGPGQSALQRRVLRASSFSAGHRTRGRFRSARHAS